MTLPPLKVCRRIRSLHGMAGSSNANEANNAREKLTKLLAEYNLTWNDLPAIFAALAATDASNDASAAASQTPTDKPEINVLNLVLRLVEDHVAITPPERMAVALWVLHCWVFDQFTITPRLALLSPVRGCGKTTLLALIELLTAEPCRTDNPSASGIYHLLDRRPNTTLLVDEGDNLDLLRNNVLRTVFNSGHRRGGSVTRFISGGSRHLPTFAPLCIAAIGNLPLPLMHRAITINMQRAPGGVQIQQLDEHSPVFAATQDQIQKWATTCSLTTDPEIPPSLRNRAADNWRVLLAIADALSAGDEARAAATELNANRQDEDAGVILLTDIRSVLMTRGGDRIFSSQLVEVLVGLDDGPWHDWRGPNDNRLGRKLTQGELSRLLRPFHIRPKTIWPAQRRPCDKSARGYLRCQFEAAWRAYCPSPDTPTQPNKITRLPRG
jgi:hypothetical protein